MIVIGTVMAHVPERALETETATATGIEIEIEIADDGTAVVTVVEAITEMPMEMQT